jgi:hypothetical protein
MITTINEFRKFNEDANDNDAFVKKHIDDVEVGDVIMCEDGHERTVTKSNIKKGGFTGTTIFGDSWNSGTKPVLVRKFKNWKANEAVTTPNNEELVKNLRDVDTVKNRTDAKGTVLQKDYNKDEEAFIKHMDDEMSWNSGDLCKYRGDMHFTYFCMPGSSVTKDLKAAAKEFGVKIDVDKLSSDYYEITVVPNNFKKNKIEPATDYTELDFKMDKFMPDDKETQDEYHKLLDAGDKPGLINFFMNNADFEKMDQYMPGDGTPDGFIDYLLANKNK